MTAGQLKVEILLGVTWTDISAYVRVTDSGTIRIRRGKQDEQAKPGTAQCQLQLKNYDGRFTPTNASGPYYGTFGRNTQLRVSVRNDSGTYLVRFWGEVSAWPLSWDPTGKDVWTSITASGPRRRLSRSGIPFLSPYRRAMASQPNTVGYWPLEDGDGSASFAPAPPSSSFVPDGTFSGPGVDLAADNSWAASTALPRMGDFSEFDFYMPSYAPSASGQLVRWLQSAGASTGTPSLAVQVSTNNGGTLLWEVDYSPVADKWQLFWSDAVTKAAVGNSGAVTLDPANGQQVRFQLSLKQNGTGIDWGITTLAPGATSGTVLTGNIASQTLGRIAKVAFFNGTGMTTTIGHVSVVNAQPSIFDLEAVLDGYAGETAFQRVTRLTTEAGVTAVLEDGFFGEVTELMGAQGENTFLALFDEAADSEAGLSTELVDNFGLYWRARSRLARRNSGVIMAYTDLNGMTPTADDESTVNDVTVQRVGGGSASAQSVEGLTVAAVGDYPKTYSLSEYSDDQSLPMAQWLAGIGGTPNPRWPSIMFDAMHATSLIRDEIFAMREGDELRVDNCPAFTGAANPLRVMVDGWTETLATGVWQFEINGSPAEPFQVLLLDSTSVGFLDQYRLGIGDPVATWGYVANQILTAAELNAAQPIVVAKAVTESVTSSTTMQDDDELFVTLNAGQSYEIEANLIIGGSAVSGAGDIKLAWTRTGTLNQIGTRQCTGPAIRTIDASGTTATAGTLPNILGILRRTGGHALTTAVNYGTDGTATGLVQERFILQAAVTGVLKLQWAQDTTSATATQIVSGSYIIARPVA